MISFETEGNGPSVTVRCGDREITISLERMMCTTDAEEELQRLAEWAARQGYKQCQNDLNKALKPVPVYSAPIFGEDD